VRLPNTKSDADARSLLVKGCKELGINVNDDQTDLFLTYLALMQRWSKKLNLTKILDDHEIVRKHFLDAMTAFKAIEILPGQRIMDVGSGAGIPGIPVKILQPTIGLTLVEPSQKKAAFLRTACGALKQNGVRILTDPVEAIASRIEHHGAYDHLLVRAMTLSRRRLEILAKLLDLHGDILLYQGRRLTLDHLPSSLCTRREISFILPGGTDQRRLIVLGHSTN